MKKSASCLILLIVVSITFIGCAKFMPLFKKAATGLLLITVEEAIGIVKNEINSVMERKNIPARLDIELSMKESKYSNREVSTAEVDFIIKPFKGELLFEPNKYLVKDSDMASLYIASVTSFIKILQKAYEKENHALVLSGVFEGGADNVKYGQTVGIYDEECGCIEENEVLLNGKNVNVRIYKGNPIKNIELALVRAYCIYYDFINRIKEIGLTRNSFKEINFIANEYRAPGKKYRFARLKISVSPSK